MKKLALCLLFVAALCACNGQDEANDNAAATNPETPVESSATASGSDAAPPAPTADTAAPAEATPAPAADAASGLVDTVVDTVTETAQDVTEQVVEGAQDVADQVVEGAQDLVENVLTPDETVHNAQNSLDFAGVYQPQAAGDFKEVELFSDGTYRLLKSDDQEVRGSFAWDASGNIITLQQSADPELTFFVGENQLWLNSTTAEGGPVFSKQADQPM